jgi:hypothetical protein
LKNKGEKMTETIYQRPPKKDEIKEFLKKVKFAIFFSLLALTASALLVGSLYLLQFKSAQELFEYAIQNLGALAALVLLTLAIMICSYDAEMSRYFIYKRYRFGHFSNMMVAYISTFALQVIAIFVAVSFKVVIPLVVFELLASIYLFIELKKSKDSRPPLARPLTSEENEVRKELISILVLDTANKSDAISKSGAFALLATFLDQDPEGSEQLFVEVKGQQYTGPDLLFDFLKSIDVDKLDENRFKTNKERAFELLRNADKKRELGTPLPSPQPLEPYYNYFE